MNLGNHRRRGICWMDVCIRVDVVYQGVYLPIIDTALNSAVVQ